MSQNSSFAIHDPLVLTSTNDRPNQSAAVFHETSEPKSLEPIEAEVIPEKGELDKEFVDIHDRITELYYKRKTMTKEEFESLHTACWLYHQKALIEHGHMEDYSVQEEAWHAPRTRLNEIDEMIESLKLRKEDWHKHGCHDPNKFLPKKVKI